MKEIIAKDNIKLQVDAKNWQQAIDEAGRLLLKSGSIKNTYIDNMINSVKQLGPYIVIAPHIAIAHARPDSNVIKADISLITLKEPVKFGNKDNDPVNIVFAFAAKENEGHLLQLTEIAKILESEKVIKKITTSLNKEEVYRLLNNREVC